MATEFDATFFYQLRNTHVQPLRDKVMEMLPEGEAMYPENQLTNIDNYFGLQK